MFRRIILTLFVVCFSSYHVFAQWSQPNGSAIGTVQALSVCNGNIFAGTIEAGVFVSTDTGASWLASNSGMTTYNNVTSFAVSGNSIYAGANINGGGSSNVFLSSNNGTSWTSLGKPYTNVAALGFCTTNIFAGTWNGVYEYTYSGTTWGWANVGLASKSVTTIFVYKNSSIWVSATGGTYMCNCSQPTTWSGPVGGFPDTLTAFAVRYGNAFAANDSILFKGVWGSGVYISLYNGKPSVACNTGLTDLRVLALAISGGDLFAGTPTGVWRRAISDILTPPAVPVLATPANGTINLPINSNFFWNSSTGALTYSLQISTDSSFTTAPFFNQTGILSASKTVSGFSNNAKYFWRVSATNLGGTSAWSTPWSFTTIIAPPPPPALVSPPTGTNNIPPSQTCIWNTSPTASSYHYQISTASNFSTIFRDTNNVTDTFLTASGLADYSKYFWHVCASNIGGTSLWSAAWDFTTALTLPKPVVLYTPHDTSTLLYDSAVFTWNREPKLITNFWLEISDDSAFSSVYLGDSTILDTFKILTSLPNKTRFFWKVKAFNSLGWGQFSPIWSFKTDVPTVKILSNDTPHYLFSVINSQIFCRYTLPQRCFVRIAYFDLRGRELFSLVNVVQGPGIYVISLNRSALPSGNYLQLVSAGNRKHLQLVSMVR